MQSDQIRVVRNNAVNPDNGGLFQYKDLKRLWRMLSSHWYVVVIALAVAYSAYLYISLTSPKGALARVQISLKYNEGNTKDYDDYSEEMTGINAPSLIRETIESLGLDVSYLIKNEENYQEIHENFPFKVTTGIVAPDFYEKYLKLRTINENTFELNYDSRGKNITQICFFDSLFTNPDLQLEITKGQLKTSTDSVGRKMPEYFIQVHDKASLIEKFQSKLSTDMTRDLAVLQVTYRDILPKRAVAFLDTLSKAYLNNTIRSQIDRNNKMVGGIDKLLRGTEQVLRGVEDSLRKYQQKTGAFNESIEDQKYMSMLTNHMLSKNELELQRINLDDFEKYILENKDASELPPPYFVESNDPFLKTTLQELYKMQVTKKESFFEVTDKNKNIYKLDNNYEIKKNDLLKYIKNSRLVIEKKIGHVEKQIAEMENPSKRGYDKDQLYVMELKRQLNVNERMYMTLLERRNTILIAQAAMAPEYKIFEAAHIIETDNPGNTKNLLYFMGLGLIAALLFIYTKNFLYQRIESLEDLKSKTNIPILGEMPYLNPRKEKLEHMIDAYTNPLTSSLLRSIRTNIEFVLSDKKSKVLLLTSHTSGEGKTFNAVNIAAILAIANKKVLLLDMDFHKPNISNALGIKANFGMNAIYKHNITVPNAITKTHIKNLDVILMEKSEKDASEMILSEKTKEIIDYGKDNYEYVIIDTPPIGLISDANTLMKFTDTNIYILNAATPYNEAIEQAQELVEKNNFKIHFILNKVYIKQLQYYSRSYKNYRYAYAS